MHMSTGSVDSFVSHEGLVPYTQYQFLIQNNMVFIHIIEATGLESVSNRENFYQISQIIRLLLNFSTKSYPLYLIFFCKNEDCNPSSNSHIQFFFKRCHFFSRSLYSSVPNHATLFYLEWF